MRCRTLMGRWTRGCGHAWTSSFWRRCRTLVSRERKHEEGGEEGERLRLEDASNDQPTHHGPIYTTIIHAHRDYLADCPMPEVTFEKSLFIRTELERVAADKPMAPFDETR